MEEGGGDEIQYGETVRENSRDFSLLVVSVDPSLPPSCHATFEFEIRGLFQPVTILPFPRTEGNKNSGRAVGERKRKVERGGE